MISMKKYLTLIPFAMVLPMQSVFAETEGKIYLNPAVGYHMFGSKLDLKDTEAYVIGGEYVISPQFGAEVSYLYSKADIDGASGDVKNSQYTLDGLYYTPEMGNWQPFLNIGIGHATFDFGSTDNKETQLNLGLGTRYHFDDKWSARLQYKVINSLDEERWDQLVTLGVSYAFGGMNKSAPVAPMMSHDSDGDGIIDEKDQCPGTLSGVYVDPKGCAVVVKMKQPESIKLQFKFASDSAKIPAIGIAEIEALVDLMKQFEMASLEIKGYTDSTGNKAYNKILSKRRADAVRDLLVSEYGIEASRISAVGYGQEQPIASNSTKEGRLENRRVIAEINQK